MFIKQLRELQAIGGDVRGSMGPYGDTQKRSSTVARDKVHYTGSYIKCTHAKNALVITQKQHDQCHWFL